MPTKPRKPVSEYRGGLSIQDLRPVQYHVLGHTIPSGDTKTLDASKAAPELAEPAPTLTVLLCHY